MVILYIKNTNDEDEHFERKFVLLLIRVFLVPNTRIDILVSYSNIIEDVNRIPTYNWIKFMLDFLVSNIIKVQLGKVKHLQGCLVFF